MFIENGLQYQEAELTVTIKIKTRSLLVAAEDTQHYLAEGGVIPIESPIEVRGGVLVDLIQEEIEENLFGHAYKTSMEISSIEGEFSFTIDELT